MSYTTESQVPPEIAEPEIKLLRGGFSYREIENILGARSKTVSERNRLVYKIDLWESFRGRIKRDGIPNRLTAPDKFCNWFCGFFDGEGTIHMFTRLCRSGYPEYRLGVRLQIRDDDADALTLIKDNLKAGHIAFHKANGRTNPSVSWTCERVEDLAEVIIPLFERYPLHTKKAHEFTIWKPIVISRYISTLGGYSNRKTIPEDERLAFHDALQRLKDIRTYA